MITRKDIYEVFAAIVPLYAAMFLAYGSVRWWRVFTPDQCSGINRFVAVFAVPLLSFHFISTNNPYAMNYHFVAADTLQKLAVLAALSLWHRLAPPRRRATLDWTITFFSLSTLPNTLVMGIPLLRAMYGDFSAALMVQIVVLQSVVWYTLMLFLFEYRAAKALIADQFPPEIAGSIASFRVDSDVLSLAAAPLQADAEVGADGRLRVLLRRSTSPSIINSTKSITTPRASNLTGVEIYSLQSSREPTPRGSSFNQSDFYAMMSSPASAGLDEEVGFRLGWHRGAGTKSGDFFTSLPASYQHQNPVSSAGKNSRSHLLPPAAAPAKANSSSSKELHMYVWSASSSSPASEANLKVSLNIAVSPDFGAAPPSKSTPPASDFHSSRVACENGSLMRRGDHGETDCGASKRPGTRLPATGSKKKDGKGEEGRQAEENQAAAPPASVMGRLILIMVWRKLIRNPNTYSSLIGLVWSFVSFRWEIEMPVIVKGSIAILSDAGLGMAMFSLGLFMALQPKLIACGKSMATFSMIVRFLAGPAIIAATSVAIGVRGVLLHVAIVQAALPQGIVPFVFAKEYNCHPEILSTVVIFGMLVALPITILYYVLLGV